MNKLPFFAWTFSLALTAGNVFAADSPRQTTRIDDGWRFALGHANDPAQDFDHGMREARRAPSKFPPLIPTEFP